MILKACKVQHLTDARYFSARGASIMGFDLDPNSPEFVSPERLHAIREWVDGVKILGEFGLSSPDHIMDQAAILNLDFIQLPHFYDQTELHTFEGIRLIQTIVVHADEHWENLAGKITDIAPMVFSVELDFTASGMNPLAGESIGINGLNQLLPLHNIFLKAPLFADSIARVKELSQLPNLSFTGSEEEKTGFKSFEAIDEVLDYLEDEGLFDPYL